MKGKTSIRPYAVLRPAGSVQCWFFGSRFGSEGGSQGVKGRPMGGSIGGSSYSSEAVKLSVGR